MDMISLVRSALEARTGQLRSIADETGIAYDTLLRIKNAEGDPGYSKVARLAEHFGFSAASGAPADDVAQQVSP